MCMQLRTLVFMETLKKGLYHFIIITVYLCTLQEELDPDILKGGKEVRIKISGDGTQLCRNSNFLIISFCLLNLPKSVLSPKG